MDDNAGNVSMTERIGEKEYVHVSVENPPIVIVFTPEQAQELKGTILEGTRGISLIEKHGRLIVEQLA